MVRERPEDVALGARAAALSAHYLGGHARPRSVRWVDTMTARWGSCTPAAGTIRISRRVADMPTHVRDYVLLHELTHLLVPGHGPNFWTLLGSYPHLERARTFLADADVETGADGGSDGGTDGGADADGGTDADADAGTEARTEVRPDTSVRRRPSRRSPHAPAQRDLGPRDQASRR